MQQGVCLRFPLHQGKILLLLPHTYWPVVHIGLWVSKTSGSKWNIESLVKYPTINYTTFGCNNMSKFFYDQISADRFVLNLKKWKNSRCHFYHPHLKDGEGTVFTGVCLSTSEEYLSPSHNTSTGPMSFPGGTPSPSHNTSIDLMSFPRGFPSDWSRVLTQLKVGYPSPRQGVTPEQGTSSQVRMGYPTSRLGIPSQNMMGYTPGQDGVEYPSARSGWGTPPTRTGYLLARSGWGTAPPPDCTAERALVMRRAVCLLHLCSRTVLFLLIFYYWSWGKKKLSGTLVRIPCWILPVICV